MTLCHACLKERRRTPNTMQTFFQGTALCEEHVHVAGDSTLAEFLQRLQLLQHITQLSQGNQLAQQRANGAEPGR